MAASEVDVFRLHGANCQGQGVMGKGGPLEGNWRQTGLLQDGPLVKVYVTGKTEVDVDKAGASLGFYCALSGERMTSPM